ncbi:MAG: hypothetical protein J0L61_05585 [Planctomycetes bacterium]|nr:hypothetical protein [Planctomycetota bacterium]
MHASFEEKSVWVQLVCLLVALGGYLVIAGRMMAAGVSELPAYAPLFVAAVVLLVVMLGVGHALALIGSRPEGRDERDRRIDWRAEHGSSWVLAAGVFASITAMVLGVPNVWVAHTLLVSMMLSEVLGLVLKIRFYRLGV